MRKKNYFKIASLFILISLFQACSGGSKISFVIDNPTEGVLQFKIDDQDYNLAPGDLEEISLKAGLHHLEGALVGKVNFMVYANRPGGMINPSLSPYVVVRELYVVENTANPMGSSFMNRQKVTIDGVEFNGLFQRYATLFIEKNWKYGLKEDFPETISLQQNMKSNIQAKIFRQKDFITYYENYTQQPGYFAKNRQNSPEEKDKSLPLAVSPLPSLSDAALEKAMKELKEVYQEYLKASSAGEQEDLQKAYTQKSSDFLKIYATRARSLGLEENRKHTEISSAMTNAFSASVLVLP
ncbi:MAG: hypothetical protein KDK66_03685 [Deltaproteobacteria bacterium]|nr:hypothetical protein [Deltaproteobacteria bacterium]